MTTTIVNKHHKLPYDVYIGRGSPFGNPYVIGVDGTREEVISKYIEYFNARVEQEEDFKKSVLALKGKRLAYFCHPKACHGDVIIKYLEDGALDIETNTF